MINIDQGCWAVSAIYEHLTPRGWVYNSSVMYNDNVPDQIEPYWADTRNQNWQMKCKSQMWRLLGKSAHISPFVINWSSILKGDIDWHIKGLQKDILRVLICILRVSRKTYWGSWYAYWGSPDWHIKGTNWHIDETDWHSSLLANWGPPWHNEFLIGKLRGQNGILSSLLANWGTRLSYWVLGWQIEGLEWHIEFLIGKLRGQNGILSSWFAYWRAWMTYWVPYW